MIGPHEKIVASDLPAELQAGLDELFAAWARLKPELDRPTGGRLNHFLNHLLDEVCDPATPVHWWEMTLYLVRLAAGRRSESAAAQASLQAIERVLPQLKAKLGVSEPVRLEPITDETVRGICLLSDTLQEPQSLMVAPNMFSLAQAHFNPYAWFRAIYAGKAPVGFMMIVDDDQTPEYFLWRFMIAVPFQGRDYGRQAIQRLVEYVRTRPGAKELGVSCGEGPGSPEMFYRKVGFIPTGEKLDDEIVLKMAL